MWGMGGSRSRAADRYSSAASLHGAECLALTDWIWPTREPESHKKKGRPPCWRPPPCWFIPSLLLNDAISPDLGRGCHRRLDDDLRALHPRELTRTFLRDHSLVVLIHEILDHVLLKVCRIR